MTAQIDHADQYSDLQSLLDDTNRLIEATKESNMGDITDLRHDLEKFQLDSTLVVDKIVNFQIPKQIMTLKLLNKSYKMFPGIRWSMWYTTNSKQRVSQSLYCLNNGSWKREKLKRRQWFCEKNRNSGMRLGKRRQKNLKLL